MAGRPAAPEGPPSVGASAICGSPGGSAVTALCLSKSNCAVSGHADGAIQVWRLTDGSSVLTVPRAHTGPGGVQCLSLVVLGPEFGGVEAVLSGGSDGALRFRSLVDGSLLGEASDAHEGRVVACAAARDGLKVYSAGVDGAARMLLAPALSGGQRGVAGDGPLVSLQLAREGSVLVTGSAAGTLHVWRASDLAPLHAFWGHTAPVAGLALSRSGDLALSCCGGGDCSLRLWRTASPGQAAQVMASPPPGPGGDALDEPRCLAASGDCGTAFVGYTSGAVRSWRTSDGVCTRTLSGLPNNGGAVHPSLSPSPVVSVALSHNEERAVACHADGSVRLLRVTPSELVVSHLLVGHRDEVRVCALSKDGGSCTAGGVEGCLRTWRPTGLPTTALPLFNRTACLSLNTRAPGCIPVNLQKVIQSSVQTTVKEVGVRARAGAEKVRAFIEKQGGAGEGGAAGGAAAAE